MGWWFQREGRAKRMLRERERERERERPMLIDLWKERMRESRWGFYKFDMWKERVREPLGCGHLNT